MLFLGSEVDPIKTDHGWQFYANGAVVPEDSHDVQLAKEQHQQALLRQAKLSDPTGLHNQHPVHPIHHNHQGLPGKPVNHFEPIHHNHQGLPGKPVNHFEPIHHNHQDLPGKPVNHFEPFSQFQPKHLVGHHEEPVYRPWIPARGSSLRSAKTLFRPNFGRY
jgi:hypothetical protein